MKYLGFQIDWAQGTMTGAPTANEIDFGGMMHGSFFGKDLEGMGGIYDFSTGDYTATGAFKGYKQ